jgi:hypothetical protein
MFYKKLYPYWVFLACPFFSKAQNTTGGIIGTVKAAFGEPLAGALVKIIHEPTGTQYLTQTQRNGIFEINNMNPGGPYTIEVSSINYLKEKKSNIYLRLGEPLSIDFRLAIQPVYLGNVTVTASAKASERFMQNGIGTIITEDKIAALPSVGRNMHDYLRSVPQAKLISGNEGAVSMAGQNNRFNAFYIDGAVSNDVFGLAASGTNGGRAGISPIPMEAVNQFQVSISPFDASLGNFTGAGINAVTRSGTNKTEGSVYYSFSNHFLTGKTPTGPKEEAVKPDGFSMQNFGARLQGAITKNKLFYFINIDFQKDNRPQPFAFSGYNGNTKSIQTISILSNSLKTNYRYDPGTFLDNPEMLHANRMVMRFDWNHNNKQKFSFSYRYTNGERINTNSSNSNLIHFSNDGYLLATNTHSFSFEMKTITGKNSGNKLLAAYTSVNDNRDPLGKPFPRVRINDGEGAFVFGTDNSSTINLLTQSNWTIFDKYHFIAGKHVMSMGIDIEYSKICNAFIQNSFGNYTYASLGDFLTNGKPSVYQTGYSLIDKRNDDRTSAAADFSAARGSIFFNDKIQSFRNFTVNYGLRIDQYLFLTNLATDDYTNQVAIPQFQKYWNMHGAQSGLRTSIPVSISPRFGFSFMPGKNRISIKGGLGVFAGRIPLAWPGGAYQNNGLYIGGYMAANTELNKIRFRANPYQQWKPEEFGVTGNKAPLNLTAAKLSMPKTARAWLAVEIPIGNQWSFTTETMFSRNLNEIDYTNINLLPPIGNAIGPDNRYVYSIANNGRIPLNPNGTNPFDYAILISNHKNKTGYTYNHTATLAKRTSAGFNIECHYNLCKSVILNDGTSSVNLSQWRFMETVNGRNFGQLSQSDFSAGHRIFVLLSKLFQPMGKNFSTTVSLAYTGESGSPFSYVYGNGSMTRDDGIYGGNDLVYIPTANELSGMVFLPYTNSNTLFTAQQQKDALEKYIEGDAYLKNSRGKYAERNGSRTPFTHIVDLKLKAAFWVKLSGRKYRFQISYDVYNLGNLINRGWGRRYYQQNDNFALVKFAGYTSETNLSPRYQFDPTLLRTTPWNVSNSLSPAYTARWISQLGVQIIFN